MPRVSRMVYQTEETRNLILARAEEVFVAQGFFDAQMKDIADAVGMSRHTLYRYYQNKIDLGMAIANRILVQQSDWLGERVEALLQQSERTGFDRLSEFLLKDAMQLMDGEDGRFLAEFDAYFSNHRAPADFQEQIGDAASADRFSKIDELIRNGHADGSVRKDFTVKQFIEVLTGLRAIQKEVLLRGELFLGMEGDVDKLPHRLAQMLVRGIASQPS